MIDYFYIKQRCGRRDSYRIYKREPKKCSFVCGYPSESAAAAQVKKLNNDKIKI